MVMNHWIKEKTYSIEISDKQTGRGEAKGYAVYVRVYDPCNKRLKRSRVDGITLSSREEWDKVSMRVNPAIPNSIEMTKRILDTLERVKRENGSLMNYLKYWLLGKQATQSIAYQNRIQKLINKIAAFLKYSHKSYITLAEVDYKFLDDFNNYLSRQPVRKNASRTLSRNAIVDYFKIFKTILCDAESRGEFKDNPFRLEGSKKYTREINEHVVIKESLTAEELKTIESLELSGPCNIVRDLFLFSFYTCGMRFEDCITLSWDVIKDDRITYKMIKNGKLVTLEITPEIQMIMNKYRNKGNKYVFPLLKSYYGPQTGFRDLSKEQAEKFSREKSRLNTYVNRGLKILAEKAGITKNLSFHIARHTFASLYDAAYGTEAAQHALHHSNIRTTRMYLDKGMKEEELKRDTLSFYQKISILIETEGKLEGSGPKYNKGISPQYQSS